ncbi:Protein of unknown function [Geosporobacter subterraneus DSM 17957]|uniref:DUF3849 domain-containing protein n=1 Tax=Geosporobacter subterraneus DSM 17957 TaxID=1121919 RepID=A0A1M6HDF7_9FIRM|nr:MULTISPECIES: DUF3849 domain-containing protein [Clostridia]SHJ20173.1 Protein of unknown function [Geosporobacter subterraneus DSM 17957]
MENQPVYKQDADYARQQDELALYRDSNRINGACAQAIEQAIKDSNYALYRYDLDSAAQKVIAEYGAERVAWVLAATLQNLEHDGRFSRYNKDWGKGFSIPKERSIYYTINTHPTVLDGFIDVARKEFAALEKSAPKAEKKTSVLNRLEEGKKAAVQETSNRKALRNATADGRCNNGLYRRRNQSHVCL